MAQSATGPEHLIHMANDIAHFFACGRCCPIRIFAYGAVSRGC